eukprot:403350653
MDKEIEDPQELLNLIKSLYEKYDFNPIDAKSCKNQIPEFLNEKHAMFVRKAYANLPAKAQKNDSCQPWFLYWFTTSLENFNLEKEEIKLQNSEKRQIVEMLRQLQNPRGGFGGAPGHSSNLIASYAAVLTLVNIGTHEAFDLINVSGMKDFLISMKNKILLNNQSEKSNQKQSLQKMVTAPQNSYQVHENGENDLRGIYCAMVIAKILNILDQDLIEGVGDLIARHQTYEGGLANVQYGEAQGAYAFCGLASLILINETHKLNLDRLIEWLSSRQMIEEGGFNGRINKVVDSCYGFWIGTCFELFDIAMKGQGNLDGQWLYNIEAAQGYVKICCQNEKGGVKDKPDKNPDIYHSFYSVSGLSSSQYQSDYNRLQSDDIQQNIALNFTGNEQDFDTLKYELTQQNFNQTNQLSYSNLSVSTVDSPMKNSRASSSEEVRDILDFQSSPQVSPFQIHEANFLDNQQFNQLESNLFQNNFKNIEDALFKSQHAVNSLSNSSNNFERKLRRINPVFNCRYDYIAQACEYFKQKNLQQ